MTKLNLAARPPQPIRSRRTWTNVAPKSPAYPGAGAPATAAAPTAPAIEPYPGSGAPGEALPKVTRSGEARRAIYQRR
jgi:hypothetical protein